MIRYEEFCGSIYVHTGRKGGCDELNFINADSEFKGVRIGDVFDYLKSEYLEQLKGEGFNHKIERMHSNVRERTKVFRGFGSIDGAYAIMKGYEIFYNFIRKHQATGKCPYELATDLKLENPNKWLELIQISKKR